MRILISNDDGIDAPGLKTLVDMVSGFAEPVVFAPEKEQSGAGHRVTVDRSILVREIEPNRFAVQGTPADCVRIALFEYDFEFDLMLAGINDGGNLGVDVYMSGTAAAAREASYCGLPSIAISQYKRRGRQVDWGQSAMLAWRGIEQARARNVADDGFWNVNLPCIDEVGANGSSVPVRFCKLDRNPHRIRYERNGDRLTYEGIYQERPRDPASDVDLCFGGAVTISRCL